MPDKHPNTHRWGGPGASHEDATKPMPDPKQPRPDEAVGSRPNVSQVSGGGGEQDEKHSHVDNMRSSKSHATDSPSPTSTRSWRKNQSRSSREAEAEAEAQAEAQSEVADEPATWEADTADIEIQVRTDNTIAGSDALIGAVVDQVGEALRRFEAQITRVEVHLSDVNAGRTGPADKRCSIEVRPKGMAPVATSDEADTIQQATAGAGAKMARLLESEFGKRADNRGRDSIRGGI